MQTFYLSYHPEVKTEDLPKINKNIQETIRKAIEKRLLKNPIQFGAELRKSLKGYRKLRVGNYRVIYKIISFEIRIYRIGHRKEVYEKKIREWVN